MKGTTMVLSVLLVSLMAAAAFNTFYKKPADNFLGQNLMSVQAFSKWNGVAKKAYMTPAEQDFRLRTFVKNHLKIMAHNKDAKKTYTLGLNDFADLTHEEFMAKTSIKNYQPKESVESDSIEVEHKPLQQQQEKQVDYRNYLQTQSVAASGNCNDNYAWIGALAMSANYQMQKKPSYYRSFSPQTYIDCTGNFGNFGCGGGYAVNCLQYSEQWGVDTLNDYPYYGYQRACRTTTGYFKNRQTIKFPSLKTTQIYSSLISSPRIFTAGIDISGAQFYSGGVFQGPCSATPNQNVLIIGAGTDFARNMRYWLLMNTFGSTWGEGGMMKIARFDKDGDVQYSSCGITQMVAYPQF